MAKKELTMKDLIAKKGVPQAILAKVPSNLRGKIRADLDAIIEAKAAGKPTPGQRKIAEFFSSRYNYHVAPSTVHEWLKKVQVENNVKAQAKRK